MPSRIAPTRAPNDAGTRDNARATRSFRSRAIRTRARAAVRRGDVCGGVSENSQPSTDVTNHRATG